MILGLWNNVNKMMSMNYASEALLFNLQQQNVLIAIRSLQLCFDVEGWVTNITRAIGLASGKTRPHHRHIISASVSLHICSSNTLLELSSLKPWLGVCPLHLYLSHDQSSLPSIELNPFCP